ncbi:hypothetical protein ATO12_19245 [Aquimarina atlantica]|uniref:Uncharacterized protein n=1 Tax=Aquimarina atlantica TaxID=1317122 RepID=A0A023BT88_9FLAO|nr:hypothetical protein [Aquimarina atlantica]EZH73144.1 hypothetical protein ATO12_19245 [Aquimarina atlantica]
MSKSILSIEGANYLSKAQQKQINGGALPECPTFFPGDCFAGAPFYCNTQGLPICDPIDATN